VSVYRDAGSCSAAVSTIDTQPSSSPMVRNLPLSSTCSRTHQELVDSAIPHAGCSQLLPVQGPVAAAVSAVLLLLLLLLSHLAVNTLYTWL
jgi:hypothetical protein